MFVCICNALTDREVRAAIASGTVRTAQDIYLHFKTEPQCGQCMEEMLAMLQDAGVVVEEPATTTDRRRRRRAAHSQPIARTPVLS